MCASFAWKSVVPSGIGSRTVLPRTGGGWTHGWVNKRAGEQTGGRAHGWRLLKLHARASCSSDCMRPAQRNLREDVMSSSGIPARSLDQTWRSASEHSASSGAPGRPRSGATEHTRTATERRRALNGYSYTEQEFCDWYGDRGAAIWEKADPVPEHSSGATEHATTSATMELAVIGNPTAPVASNVSPSLMQGTGEMQCPVCDRVLCGTQSLAFFRRINKEQGVEVHLMLKPEIADVPPDFQRMPTPDKGSLASWQCACGHKIGDTRNIGPRKAPMTAFKSSSVKLFGQHHKGQKSKWPSIYTDTPFNGIEVRDWSDFRAPA